MIALCYTEGDHYDVHKTLLVMLWKQYGEKHDYQLITRCQSAVTHCDSLSRL